MIAFDNIPATPIPGSQVEIANVRAISGLPAAQQKNLLIGLRSAAGSVAANMPRRIVSADQAADHFGRGSMLHAMVVAMLLANASTELWAVALDADAGGTAATWTVTMTGPATASGPIALMIAGVRVPVGVVSGDSATAMAAAIVAAVNAAADLPVTASNAAGVVTLTARHKGTYGNDVDVRVNHYDGEALPAGAGLTIAAGATGATNPDITSAFAAIGDEWFQNIAVGINDAANITAADTEMTLRWGPQKQKEGRAYFGYSASLSSLLTFGATRNGIFTTVMGARKVPTPPWKVAACVAGIASLSLAADPARPMTDLVLPGVIAPLVGTGHRFTRTERAQLLNTGISTFRVNAAGEVAVERLISCYQLDNFGGLDPSYRDIMTTATLGYMRYSWRSRTAQKYPRAKLTQDTIASIRAETIALARDWFDAGLLEDIDQFIASLVIERDPTTATQLNVLMAPNTVNPLLQLAARIEFIL